VERAIPLISHILIISKARALENYVTRSGAKAFVVNYAALKLSYSESAPMLPSLAR